MVRARTPRNTATRDKHRNTIAQHHPPCHWCKEPIDYEAHHHHPNSFQVDHVIPIAAGGPDTLDNKVPSHRRCNRAKSDKVNYQPGVTYMSPRRWTT